LSNLRELLCALDVFVMDYTLTVLRVRVLIATGNGMLTLVCLTPC
jgi:hypothetical protein